MTLNLPSMTRRLWRLLAMPALLLALSAHAGNISFNLSLNDNKLVLINQGNSAAFHPTVLRMLGDGRWEALPPAPGVKPTVELAPNAPIEFAWPDNRPPSTLTPIEALRPVMVRFFDQAGASFGQISFFNHPLTATEDQVLKARYINGQMTVAPPKSGTIRASWLLWPQEDGITTLAGPLQLANRQPAARRIVWQPGMEAQRFDLGRGLPVTFLLHETDQGLRSQFLSDGQVQGRQQRAGWLDASKQFYWLAQLAAAAAGALLLWQFASGWRNRAIRAAP